MTAASPATKAERDRKSRTDKAHSGRPAVESSCQVELASGRGRHIGWVAFGIVAGLLLILKMGTVAHWVGVALLVVAGFNLKSLIVTLLRPAGEIVVRDDEVVLPKGVCRGSETFELSKLEHAFFLRRAVPWTRAGPVLVVEAGGRIFHYPRDWFASDADQRRVAAVLNRRLGRL